MRDFFSKMKQNDFPNSRQLTKQQHIRCLHTSAHTFMNTLTLTCKQKIPLHLFLVRDVACLYPTLGKENWRSRVLDYVASATQHGRGQPQLHVRLCLTTTLQTSEPTASLVSSIPTDRSIVRTICLISAGHRAVLMPLPSL